jgi:hypothetical protein
MEKKLNKPHTINERIDSPLGLLGVPPDHPAAANIPFIMDKGGSDDGG